MAYMFCIKIGLWGHRNIAKIKFKKTLNCYQFSIFRHGLDLLTTLILEDLQPQIDLFTQGINLNCPVVWPSTQLKYERITKFTLSQ